MGLNCPYCLAGTAFRASCLGPNRGERIRTSDLLTPSQSLDSHNSLEIQDLRGLANDGAAPGAAPYSEDRHAAIQTDPDLAVVVEAWVNLPSPLRAGILAMIRAAGEPSAAP